MMDFLASIEQLSFSTWVREGGAIYGYALILFMHTIGTALVAGSIFIIDVRLLGVSPALPLQPLTRLYNFMLAGFVLNTVTGTILLMADATTKLTNYDFYIKMGLVVVGLLVQRTIQKKLLTSKSVETNVVPAGMHGLAWLSLFCWFGTVLAGRLLAYLGPVAGLA
jgi:hypothetical protein